MPFEQSPLDHRTSCACQTWFRREAATTNGSAVPNTCCCTGNPDWNIRPCVGVAPAFRRCCGADGPFPPPRLAGAGARIGPAAGPVQSLFPSPAAGI